MNEKYPDIRPVLRNLEAVAVDQNGERMVSLHDPAQYSEITMTLSMPAFYLLTLFDGEKNLAELCSGFKNRFGADIRPEEVIELIEKLDEALMLDNERFAKFKKSVVERFIESPERPAVLAGRSYPESPADLLALMDKMMKNGTRQSNANIRAIVVPHIDFRVGADMMAAGWKELVETDADLFIILGTGHSLSEDFFSCLEKDYSTPLGAMRVDREFFAKFRENFGEEIGGHVEAQRMEHSIEFQSLFLSYLFRKRPEVTAVPILLSFPEHVWDIDHPVFNGKRVDRFIEALKKTVDETDRKTVFVASVDFSHVGARFGDNHELSDEELQRIEKDDRELINALIRMDAEKFQKKILQTNGTNRVCGYPVLYTLLKICGADRGELIEYRQNIEGAGDSLVSFTTMALFGNSKNPAS